MVKHRATGIDFKYMIEEAGAWLGASYQAVNALNVFPVPDGDTGTNMDHTMQSAIKAMRSSNSPTATGEDSVSALAGAASQGALLGARGNSGVILSQMLRGLAMGLDGMERFGAAEYANALTLACEFAYRSVSQPVEGTMLTVIRMAAAKAKELADAGMPLETVVAEALEEAKIALRETPEMLPILKEAGVVDAGGQGLCLILEGALYGLRGELGKAAQQDLGHIEGHWIEKSKEAEDNTDEAGLGYCTEFTVEGRNLDSEKVRRQAMLMGTSVIVVGEETAIKVHLHTQDPDAALEYASSLGKLISKKVDNMEEQRRQFLHQPVQIAYRPQAKEYALSIAVIAVSPGPGLDQVFQGLGASVVPGGQSMNPAVQDILTAIETSGREQAILLPNNRNVVLTAGEAARLSSKSVVVVPTESIPEGISALMCFVPDEDMESNRRSMAEAVKKVITAEVTRATRDVTINQVKVQAGKPVGLLQGKLVAAGESDPGVVMQLLGKADLEEDALVTLYYGEDASASDAEAISREIVEAFPRVEVQVIYGGQPYYTYILSIES
ncbi:MAG: DAK2 domain-containing protein [Dehalococcoidia bacterium]|nr:DAK2 domain-containing protein [Dehalococcoidia bacterium]